jgi:hypothetical protein
LEAAVAACIDRWAEAARTPFVDIQQRQHTLAALTKKAQLFGDLCFAVPAERRKEKRSNSLSEGKQHFPGKIINFSLGQSVDTCSKNRGFREMFPEHKAWVGESREFLPEEELSAFDGDLFIQESTKRRVAIRQAFYKAELDIRGLDYVASRFGKELQLQIAPHHIDLTS